MDYYTIRLDPNASRICTVIFPWEKYSYKRHPIGIVDSLDIFQSKMLELMEYLEYVQAYLDDLLCISRSSLEDYLNKLKEVLRHLCNAGLKVNVVKSTFCTLEIEYLGYILTREGIKPQSNQVQAILAIHPPKKCKGTQAFPRHGAILPGPLGKTEQNAHPSHLIGWKVQSDQSLQSQRDQEGALALG
jgi:hypothetical protein